MSIFFPLGEVKLLKCWGFSLGKHLQAIYTSKSIEKHISYLQPLSCIHRPDVSGRAWVALSSGSKLWPWASFEAAEVGLVFTVQPWAGFGPVCVQSLSSYLLSKLGETTKAYFLTLTSRMHSGTPTIEGH